MYSRLINKYSELPVVGKATLWFLFCTILQKCIALITTPIFTRIMSPEQYGQFNVFSSWMSIITIIVTMSLSAGVFTQGIIKYEEYVSELSSSLQGLNLVLCFGWCIVYLIFREYVNRFTGLNTLEFLCMGLIIWSSAVYNLWAVEQRVYYKYRGLVIYTILFCVLQPVLSVLLVVFSQDKVLARILGITIVQVMLYSVIFFVKGRRLKDYYSSRFWKYAIVFSIPLIPHYLSQILLSSSDRIMIAHLTNEYNAGLYSLSYSLAQVTSFFSMAILQSINPWLYRRIKNKEISEIGEVGYSVIYLIASINILLIIFAPELIKVFAPPQYYSAIWVIPPIAIANVIIFMYSLFAPFEFYYEKRVFITISTLLAALVNIFLNYELIPVFGYIAAAYTSLVAYVVYVIMHFLFMNYICRKEIDNMKPYSVKKLFRIVLAFVILGGLMTVLYNYLYFRYALISIIFIILYKYRSNCICQVTQILKLKDK